MDVVPLNCTCILYFVNASVFRILCTLLFLYSGISLTRKKNPAIFENQNSEPFFSVIYQNGFVLAVLITLNFSFVFLSFCIHSKYIFVKIFVILIDSLCVVFVLLYSSITRLKHPLSANFLSLGEIIYQCKL